MQGEKEEGPLKLGRFFRGAPRWDCACAIRPCRRAAQGRGSPRRGPVLGETLGRDTNSGTVSPGSTSASEEINFISDGYSQWLHCAPFLQLLALIQSYFEVNSRYRIPLSINSSV